MPNVVSVTIRGIDQFSGMVGRATRDFGALRALGASAVIALASAATAAAGAAAALTQQAINTADATGKAAQKAGLAVEQFSALAYAGNLAELSQEQLVKAARKWSEEAAKGNSLTGNFRDDLLQLADQFQNSADGAAKVAAATRLFGKAGQEMIPLLNQGSAALRTQFDEAQRFGLVIGQDFARNADQFNDNLQRMQAVFQGLWLQIAEQVLPTLIRLSETMLELTKNGEKTAAVARDVGTAFAVLAEINPWLALISPGGAAIDAGAKAGAQRFADTFRNALGSLAGKGASGLASLAPQDAGGLFDPDKSQRGETLRNQMLEAAKKSSDDLVEVNAGLLAEEARHYQERLAMVETLAQTQDEKRRLEYAAEVEHNARLSLIAKRYTKDRQQLMANWGQFGAQVFGNLATAAQAFGKKGFAAFKAFSIAQAIAATYESAVNSYAWASKFGGPVAGAIAAAAAVAAGLANVAQISAAKPSGQAHAGLTSTQGGSYELSRGERVLAPPQNQDLTRFLDQQRGTGSTMLEIHLDGEILSRAIAQRSRDGRLILDARSIQ